MSQKMRLSSPTCDAEVAIAYLTDVVATANIRPVVAVTTAEIKKNK